MLPVVKGSAAFKRGARAFTLLEMLVTIVLIIIMFVMLYGHGASGQQLARKRKCQKNLQDLHVALQIYATERDGLFSLDGKKPGNNHHKYGGNFLFVDGRLEMSNAKAPFPLPLTNGVVLLNPRP